MKEELLICQCENVEHQLIFRYFQDEKEVYLTVHLIPEYSIWKRIKNAVKYIFGYRSRYGHFDEFIFKKEDSSKLQSIVDFLNK